MSSSNQLIGWTQNAQLHTQQTPANGCRALKRCPSVLSAATTPWSGGSGYEARFQAAWSSDGLRISLNDLRTCKTICSGTASRGLGTTSRVSGLAVSDVNSRLYQLETIPGRFAITTYDIRTPRIPCFRFVRRCIGTTLTTRGIAAGLAYDQVRQLLYVATSEPGLSGNAHWILVTRAASPCQIVCRYRITGSCFSTRSFVTGLGYDDCAKMLYATNGSAVLEIRVVNPTSCSFQPVRCCAAAGPFGGLAVQSGWKMQHVGKSCTLKPCPSCPGMHMTTAGGDASLGNMGFQLKLVNAPGGLGRIAGLWLGVGCSTGFPYFCSTFHADPTIGPFIVPVAGSGCNGVATWPAPIAANPSYCGLTLCAQAIVLCRAAPLPSGIGLSDAIQFNITN